VGQVSGWSGVSDSELKSFVDADLAAAGFVGRPVAELDLGAWLVRVCDGLEHGEPRQLLCRAWHDGDRYGLATSRFTSWAASLSKFGLSAGGRLRAGAPNVSLTVSSDTALAAPTIRSGDGFWVAALGGAQEALPFTVAMQLLDPVGRPVGEPDERHFGALPRNP
jgi:hypothetical protein